MADLERSPIDYARPLPEVLGCLAAEAATGVLMVQCGEIRRELVLSRGEIQAARSTLEREMLGGWLVERGLITEEELALILLQQAGSDTVHLGRMFLDHDLLDRMVLEQELQELSLSIIKRAMAEPDIQCEFAPQEGHDQPDTLPGLTTAQLILIAARSYTDTEAMEASIGSLDRPAWPADALEVLYDEIDLTPEEAFVVSRIGGGRSLAEILKVAPVDRDRAISTVYALKVAGILELGEIPEAPPPVGQPQEEIQPAVARPLMVVEEDFTDRQRAERRSVLELASRLPQLDHYQMLDLPPEAPSVAVAEAWRTRRDLYHPDRTYEAHLRDLVDQLTAISDAVSESHELLSNPVSRARYDAVRRDLASRQSQATAEEQEAPPSEPTEAPADKPPAAAVEQPDVQPTAAEQVVPPLEPADQPPAEETEAEEPAASETAVDETVDDKLARVTAMLRRQNIGPAIKLLEEACDLEPRPAELLRLARLLFRDPTTTNRALAALRRAVVTDPGFVRAWLELAGFWRKRGKPDLERKALERALRADPNDPEAVEQYRRLTGGRGLKGFLRRIGLTTS